MLRRSFIVLISLALLCSFGIHAARAQDQPPPLMPPLVLYGIANVDGVPLTQADTEYTISIRMSRLLLIFLDSLASQGLISDITIELGSGNTNSLRQAFQDSPYCQSRVPPTELSLDANVTTEEIGNRWRVTDQGNIYTVERENIFVWNQNVSNWVQVDKLEVYEHNGLINSYTMGDLPIDDYVAQIPMSSPDVLGGRPPDDTYVLREPGTALPGDEAYIQIKGIQITDPPNPYIIIGQQAFVEMDIDAPSTIEVTLNLDLGWNLISLPVQPLDTDINVVLSSIENKYESIYRYSANPGWLWYFPAQPLLSNLSVVEAGMGYWINMLEAGQLIVQGLEPGTLIHLYPGWNLVGYNSRSPMDIGDAMSSIEGQYNSVFEFNSGNWFWFFPATPLGSNLKTARPGMGYWIEATAEGDWDIGQ